MLKGIDPLLTPDVLYALAAMGHGDKIAVVDTNFPALSVAEETTLGEPMLIRGADGPKVVEAILSVMPLEAAGRMEVMGDPLEIPAVQGEIQAIIDTVAPSVGPMHGIERFQFYDEAARSFGVIGTGERRFYGCVLLTKGVIGPDA